MSLDEIRARVIACARECGAVEVNESGGITELRAADTFATIEVGRRHVTLRLAMPGGRRLPGVIKLLFGDADVRRHRVRLRRADDVDEEIRAWLCEAYRTAVRT